jgi:hypothetical protein
VQQSSSRVATLFERVYEIRTHGCEYKIFKLCESFYDAGNPKFGLYFIQISCEHKFLRIYLGRNVCTGIELLYVITHWELKTWRMTKKTFLFIPKIAKYIKKLNTVRSESFCLRVASNT